MKVLGNTVAATTRSAFGNSTAAHSAQPPCTRSQERAWYPYGKMPRTTLFRRRAALPPWIKAIVLLPVVALGYPAILMWFRGGANLAFVRVLFTVLALEAPPIGE